MPNRLDLIHSRAPNCSSLHPFLFSMLVEAFDQAQIDLASAVRAQFLRCSNLIAQDRVATSLPYLIGWLILSDDLNSLRTLDSHAFWFSVQLKSVYELRVLSLHRLGP